ncbi:hypothetical protein TCAL_07820 [Tigriopus californicus]|uniref:SSD domain-containing protein n=1 Tax=Tigriopus californicus TaxID=6832 RepID=A0A553NQ50_TIGCA|nr:hypothetical protein TCAL_07820 [Tigriopus californicus]
MQVKQPLPNPKKFAILQTTSNLIIGKLERFFFRWGIWVATNPALVIVSSLLVASLSAVGFLNFSSESRAEKLWIPSDSPYIANKAWLDQNYPQTRRQHFALFVSETNILTPEALMEMFRVHQKVHAIKVSNKTYADLCFKLPIANIFLTKKRRRKRQALGPRNSSPSNPNDPSVVVPSEVLNATLQIENATGLNAVNATRDQRFLLDSDSPEPEKQESSQTNQDETEEDEESNSLWSGYDLDEEYEDIYEDYDFENEDYEIDFVEKDEIEDSKNGDGNGDGQSDDPQDSLSPEIYCDLVSTLDQKCLENSLLEIWRYSESRIQRLTQNDILYAVNQVAESPWFGYRTDFAVYLGAVERNSTGHIVTAKSAIYSWAASFDPDGELTDEGGVGVELDLADKLSLDFEKEMIASLLESSKEAEERSGVKIYVNVARSFNDITAEAIFFDAVKMAAGYFLMFFYTMFFLGRINLVEHRTWIAAGGIFSVAMGLGIAFGITSAIGLPYTPIHGILPFLALGIGIDDMFVIVQCWYNLSPEEQKRGLKEKIGLTMQHAGVAITVTSLTDVFAFGVGAVTILPGLQTFCVTCAIAIASIYILQASWFAALLSLDERRIRARRDGLAPCIKYRNWTPMAWSQKDMGRMFMGRVAKLLSQGVVKTSILGGCRFEITLKRRKM